MRRRKKSRYGLRSKCSDYTAFIWNATFLIFYVNDVEVEAEATEE